MARVVLGPHLQDIRGKLGNAVYDNYKGVHIVRSMPSYINNPQSEHQTLTRAALAVFVKAWKGLTLDQKQLWGVLAGDLIRGQQSDARMNRGGLISLPRGPFSGYNAFISANMNRYTYGYSTLTQILEEPNLSQAGPRPLKSFSATKNGRTITAAWEYISPGPKPGRLGIWIRSIDGGIHPQLIYTEPVNLDGNTDITEARKTSGIEVTLPNGVYQLQAIKIDLNGRTCQPSELVFIQLGGADVYTYLAARIQILNLAAQKVSVAETEIDLSANVPDGAHSVILAVENVITVSAPAGSADFFLRNTAAQGDCFGQLFLTINQGVYSRPGLIMPCSSDRKIKYQFTENGNGPNVNLAVFLLGYIE